MTPVRPHGSSREAIRERGVHLRPERTDGMAAVVSLLTLPEALAFHRALGHLADAIPDDPDGPPRTRTQKMADCLLDLVLRPGESELPPVQVLLTVVASIGALAGGDDPGEIDGHVVPAEMIRQFLLRAGAGNAGRGAGLGARVGAGEVPDAVHVTDVASSPAPVGSGRVPAGDSRSGGLG